MLSDGLDKQTTKLSLAIFLPSAILALLQVPLQAHLFPLNLLLPVPQTGLSLFLAFLGLSSGSLLGRLTIRRLGLSAEILDVALE